MWLQLFLVFIAFWLCYSFGQKGDTAKNRHQYINILILLLVLQSALRNLAVGSDTYSYYLAWEYTRDNRTWSWIWQHFYDVYVLGEGKDAGYSFLMKTIQIICPSFRVFLFIVAIAFFVPLCRFLENNLKTLNELFMSFCVYQVLFYSFFSITGIRQTIATIATIYGVKLINDRKIIQFVIIILLASFVHKSVLIFLPFYLIARIPLGKTAIVGSIVALPFIFPFARTIATFLATVSASDQYMMYAESDWETSGAQNFLLFIILSGVIVLFAKYKDNNAIPDYIANSIAISIFFTPMMWVDPSLMRVIQYFSIFVLVGLPLAFKVIKTSFKTDLVYWLFLLVLIATILRHNYEYGFLWDTMQLGENYL